METQRYTFATNPQTLNTTPAVDRVNNAWIAKEEDRIQIGGHAHRIGESLRHGAIGNAFKELGLTFKFIAAFISNSFKHQAALAALRNNS
ncbi:hypothetical protein K0U07_01110 [bacterium]|nr:hypothetical protein [bacterium]